MTYKYRGAQSLVLLHEEYILSFYETWKEAQKLQITLPRTDDKDYLSLNTLLRHVLRSSRGYIIWICEKLELPDPQIDLPTETNELIHETERYIDHLLQKWKTPLKDVQEEKFIHKTYKSNWGTEYCIDAMLEHAVMHPIRHKFQLESLIKEQK